MNRRQFLKSGLAMSAVLGIDGLVPGDCAAEKISFAETSCEGSMAENRRVLVAYASMFGSTGGVAEAIARCFCAAGYAADVRLLENAGDLSRYKAVIIGSPARSEAWLPKTVEFVRANAPVLSGMPVAYFLTCLTLTRPTPINIRYVSGWFEPVLTAIPEVRPVGIGCFAGVLDYSKMPFSIGAVTRYKMWSKGVEEGDYRNWAQIEAWAGNLAARVG
jgi:menaquinone-dependent protoporphyrinogen oxidase